MGAHYIKVDGVWVQAKRPYVKRNSVWFPVKETYVKQAGAWVSEWKYDVTPPPPPELTLEITEKSYLFGAVKSRFITVGSRIPGTSNNPEVKLIRVLASASAPPTSPLGGGYLSAKDSTYPSESWSDWHYNKPTANNTLGDHGETNGYDYKEYPVNPPMGSSLPGGKWYYFAAWSQDFDNNWSAGVQSKIWMPKAGVESKDRVVKEANFQAVTAGSVNSTGSGFVSGDLIARDSPRSNGIWFHGLQINNSVGAQGNPTIQSAKIRITRKNDAGQPSATVRLYWHDKAGTDKLPIPLADMNDATVVGTLNKGETKWFDIPSDWWPKFNTQIKGFGIKYGTGATDFIDVSSVASDIRCGEVNLVWEEAL